MTVAGQGIQCLRYHVQRAATPRIPRGSPPLVRCGEIRYHPPALNPVLRSTVSGQCLVLITDRRLSPSTLHLHPAACWSPQCHIGSPRAAAAASAGSERLALPQHPRGPHRDLVCNQGLVDSSIVGLGRSQHRSAMRVGCVAAPEFTLLVPELHLPGGSIRWWWHADVVPS